MKTNLGKIVEKKPYTCLIIISLMTGLILYSKFVFGDKILAYYAWGSDTSQSYLPTYEYWFHKIASGRFSIYDFSYGWGTNAFVVLWGLIDPFTAIPIILSYVFGVTFLGKSLVYFQILKSITISVLGMKYLHIMGYPYRSSLLPSLILGFCGYMIVTGEHYFFSTYAVFFMFILLYTEKIIQDRKMYWQLSLGVGWLSAISAYAIYQTALVIGLYVLFRSYYSAKEIREFFILVWKVLKSALLGLMFGFFSSISQFYEIFFISSRTQNSESFIEKFISSFRLLPKSLLKETYFNFFSSNLYGTVNQYEGSGDARFCTTTYFFSVLFVFAFCYFISKTIKCRKHKKMFKIRFIILVLSIFMLISCFVPLITNAFVYIQWRYIFTLLPFFMLLLTDFLHDVLKKEKISPIIYFIPCFMAYSVIMLSKISRTPVKISESNLLISILLIAILLILYMKTRNQKAGQVIFLLIFFCTMLNVIIDDGIVVYSDQIIMGKQDLIDTYHDERIEEIINKIDELEKDTFYRVDRTYLDGVTPDILLSFLYPTRTISVYDSLMNGELANALTIISGKKTYTQNGYNIGSCGMHFDNTLADIFGLKYIISNKERNVEGWQKFLIKDGLHVYKNCNINSVGLIYRDYISEDQYMSLDPIQKELALDKFVIIGDDMHENQININENLINYKTQTIDLVDTQVGKSLKLDYNLNMDAESSKVLSLSYEIEEAKDIEINFYNEGGDIIDFRSCTIDPKQKEHPIKVPSDAITIELIYDKDNILIKNCELVTGENKTYQTNGIHFDNPNMGGFIEGIVEAKSEGWLFLPIPYEKCWKIQVNNRDAEYRKADFGFIAVKVEEGESCITLSYENWVNKIGMIISIFSFLAFVSIKICLRIQKKFSISTNMKVR